MNLMQFFQSRFPSYDESTFFKGDQFPLDDEVLTDIAINAMLLVMQNQQRPRTYRRGNMTSSILSIEDYAPLVSYGVRFPWKERLTLSREVDMQSDELPQEAVIGLVRRNQHAFAQVVFVSQPVTKSLICHAKRIPALSGAHKIYRAGFIDGYQSLRGTGMKAHKYEGDDIESVVDAGFAGVMPNGICVGADWNGKPSFYWANVAAYVIGLHNDRRYFWNVTAEEAFMNNLPARAHFSIDKEYVKSLFYARSLPKTSSGRMRPILHWVQAHKRRIQEGIDIDVAKHLRGINAFEMHGVNFAITDPVKQPREKIRMAA